MEDYDIVIIGAGVIGCACARELSRYDLSILVVDKEEDVCSGTSKANSGIVHSGVDARTGSLMAQLNVLGNELMESLCYDLDVHFIRNGSLILCFEKENYSKLEDLFTQGQQNGVENLSLLSKEEVLSLEPSINPNLYAALYAPSGGIVCPFGLTIGLAENAATNGVDFRFLTTVIHVTKLFHLLDPTSSSSLYSYQLHTSTGKIQAKIVINAAGVYGDYFHNLVSEKKLSITPRRGEYCLFDQSEGTLVRHTIFQLPSPLGKGVLVTPTVHGNLLIGPTAIDHTHKDEAITTSEGLAMVIEKAKKSVPQLNFRQLITSFAGNRAHERGHDFILEEVYDSPGFIDVVGIESPGLTAAPAIGLRVMELVTSILNPPKKKVFHGSRKGFLDPKKLSFQEYQKLIQEEPAYGTIICRCEQITQGEILSAIHRTPGAVSIDGIKRRVRATSGRCQAGFCTPKLMELLSKELSLPLEAITKCGPGSELLSRKEF